MRSFDGLKIALTLPVHNGSFGIAAMQHLQGKGFTCVPFSRGPWREAGRIHPLIVMLLLQEQALLAHSLGWMPMIATRLAAISLKGMA